MPNKPPAAYRPPSTAFRTRWFRERDLADVLAIERASFEFPWRRCDFTRTLQYKNCLGKVVDVFDDYLGCEITVGYIVFELLPGSIVILNLAVDPAHRRQGAGRVMVDHLRHRALQGPRTRGIVCDVRETNLGAQLFLRSLGFRAVKTLRDQYEDTDEDAYRFALVAGGRK